MKPVIFALLTVGLCGEALADEMPTARAGDRIRIRTERQEHHFYGTRTETSDWIPGILVALGPDSLGLALDQGPDTLFVLRSSIVAAEKHISVETHEDSGRFFGLVSGIVGGLVAGAAIGARTNDIGDVLYGGARGAAAGAKAGTSAGAAIGRDMPHDRWEEIQRWPGTPFRCRAPVKVK